MDKIHTKNDLAGVVCYTHDDLPNLKVQISPDQPKDPKSRWSAFASCEGVALLYFAGKSFAKQRTADRAVRNYLVEKAAKSTPIERKSSWVPSTGDDVITWTS